MHWYLSDRADSRALPLADRHYNRQKPGTPQFVPPGRCVVLLTERADALFVMSWPYAEYPQYLQDGPLPEKLNCINIGTVRTEARRYEPACQAVMEPLKMQMGVRQNVSLFFADGGLCIV
jgi:hypothetical protein